MLPSLLLALPLHPAGRGHFLPCATQALAVVVSHSLGRTVLEEVAIPAWIGHAAVRSRRLVRQARVSPW